MEPVETELLSTEKDCTITEIFKIIGKPWTLLILRQLYVSSNEKRFGTLKNELDGISSKTLTIRLKELEKNGLLTRHRYKEIPPRVDYELTRAGLELLECFKYIDQWAQKWKSNFQ